MTCRSPNLPWPPLSSGASWAPQPDLGQLLVVGPGKTAHPLRNSVSIWKMQKMFSPLQVCPEWRGFLGCSAKT